MTNLDLDRIALEMGRLWLRNLALETELRTAQAAVRSEPEPEPLVPVGANGGRSEGG